MLHVEQWPGLDLSCAFFPSFALASRMRGVVTMERIFKVTTGLSSRQAWEALCHADLRRLVTTPCHSVRLVLGWVLVNAALVGWRLLLAPFKSGVPMWRLLGSDTSKILLEPYGVTTQMASLRSQITGLKGGGQADIPSEPSFLNSLSGQR